MTNQPNDNPSENTNESTKPKSNRGGKRPGAGAPKGNLNALKHGRRSRQLQQFSATLAANPETRAVIMKYNQTMDKRQANDLEDAMAFFFKLLDHGGKIATGQYSPGPYARLLKEPAVDRELNEGLNDDPASMKDQQSTEKKPRSRRPGTRSTHRASKKAPINQPADTSAPNNQTPDTKTTPKTID